MPQGIQTLRGRREVTGKNETRTERQRRLKESENMEEEDEEGAEEYAKGGGRGGGCHKGENSKRSTGVT